MAFRDKRMQQWFDHLQEGLGICVMSETETPESESNDETSGSEDDQNSSSSHEIGVELCQVRSSETLNRHPINKHGEK